MVTPESVQAGIASGLACEHVEVVGDGQHFQALVVSAAFAGKMPTLQSFISTSGGI